MLSDFRIAANLQARIDTRPYHGIETQYRASMSRVSVPPERQELAERTVLAYCRGMHILRSYKQYLNTDGLALLESSTAYEHFDQLDLNSIILMSELSLPNKTRPRTDLYQSCIPEEIRDSTVLAGFKAGFATGHNPPIIAISDECLNRCFFCALEGEGSIEPGRIKHMPLPVVLKLFEEFGQTGKPILLYHRGDILQWRDEIYDADYADLVKLDTTISHPVTHGALLSDPFGIEAARKLGMMKLPLDLSVHVLKPGLFSAGTNSIDSVALIAYADRVVANIELLRPEVVRIYGDRACLVATNATSKEWIRHWYDAQVTPRLNRKPTVSYPVLAHDGGMASYPLFQHNEDSQVSQWRIIESGWHYKIHTDGRLQVLMQPSLPNENQMVHAPTIREHFSDHLAMPFVRALAKLHFYYYHKKYSDTTVAFWKIFYPKLDPTVIFADFPNTLEGIVLDDPSAQLISHQILGDLPVASTDIFHDTTVGDLLDHKYGANPYRLISGILNRDDRNGEVQRDFLLSYAEGRRLYSLVEELNRNCGGNLACRTDLLEPLRDMPVIQPHLFMDKYIHPRFKVTLPVRLRTFRP